MLRFIAVIFVFLLEWSAAKKLPTFLPRCYIDDPKLNDCLLLATRMLKPQVREGIPEIKLPPFNPLVTEFGMSQLDHPIVNYTMYFWNFTMLGIDDYNFKEIHLDPKTLTIRGRILFPPVPTNGTCDVTGDYLAFHTHGFGLVYGKFESTDLSFEITGERVTRKNREYYNPKEVKINMVIEDFKVNVVDIFGKNKDLGQFINTALDVSSKIVIDAVAPTFAEVIEAMWLRYLKSLTKKIPLENLLPHSP